MNLYESILGSRWDEVDPKVKNSHLRSREFRAHCRLNVEGGSSFLGRIISRIVSLPGPARDAEVELRVRESPHGEHWERMFLDRNLTSIQSKSSDGYLVDRFGMIAFYFQLEVENGSIIHRHEKTMLRIGRFTVPLPGWMAPKVVSHESPDRVEKASKISVSLSMPIAGRILAYSGIVYPSET